MTKVIKEVVAQVRATSDQFDAELAKVEAKAKATKAAVEGMGGAQGAMGQRTAEAARQIASATETIARAGKVTGETGKQIVAQASNIAFAFGPQGAIAGALGIFTLAFATAMSNAKREAAQAAEEVRKSIADMLNAGDIEALKVRARELQFGTRAGRFEDGIVRTRARLAELERDVGVGDFGRLALIDAERAKLAELERAYKDVTEAIRNFAEDPARANPASPFRITANQGGAASGKGDAGLGGAFTAALEKDAQDFARRFADFLARAVGDSGDQIRREFNRLIEDALNVGDERAVDQLIALRDEAERAATAIARADNYLADLDLAAARGVAPTVDVFLRLADEAQRLEAELGRLTPGTDQYRKVLDELTKVEKKRSDLYGSGVGKAATPGSKESVRDMADYAREIQQAADGALQLAQHLGGASAESVTLLRAIGQIAGGLPALKKAWLAGSGLGIISAALPIVGALSSLFAQSPASAQRQEELRANTEALRELSTKVGLLGGVGVTGASASAAAGGLRSFLSGANVWSMAGGARQAARLAGLDLTELDRIAAEYGLTLNNNIESFRQLERAIADSITKLGEFGTDLESQLKQASAAARIFGVTDPQQLLALTQGAYAGRSPVLDRALAGLDLTTAEGREAARTALQGIFTTLQAGGGALGAGDLGGLTGDQLLQALLDLVDRLNAIDEAAGLTTSTVGAPSRVLTASDTQITADQASRLLGIQTAALAELRAIREALAASMTPLALPSLQGGLAPAGAVQVTITQEFYGMTSAREVAEATRSATIEGIDRALGKRALVYARHLGKAVT